MADTMTGLSSGSDDKTNDLVFESDEVNAGGLVHLVWINPADNGHYPALSFRFDGARWIIRTQPVPPDAPFERDDEEGHVRVIPG